ncbi:MAG: type II toxin-antitoxin system VapC family toxin [Acidimicrobiales bacterium]
MDAFDADALIYAAIPNDPLGLKVSTLFPTEVPAADAAPVGIGSVLLLPEVLTKPRRLGARNEAETLDTFLAWLDLQPVDTAIAELAVALGVRYGLRAADATHLATAVHAGADRFITNNRRDFPKTITEVAITYPDDLGVPD